MTPLHRNTYEQGREDGKAESAETIRKLREALDKALAENLANRPRKDCPQSDTGLPLEVIFRPLLVAGQLRTHAASGRPFILIDDEQTDHAKLVTLWHEVVHLLRMAGGYSQDEASVEEAAHRLAAACPDALLWVGMESKLAAAS